MSLLLKIEKFLERTGTPISTAGRVAVKDPGAIQRMRRGATPTAKSAVKWEQFFKDYPEGIPKKKRGRGKEVMHHVRGHSEKMQKPYPKGEEPDRNPCGYCGIRGELGCKHRKPLQQQTSFMRRGSL